MAVAVDAVGSEAYIASGVNYTGITVGSGANRALVLTLNFDGVVPTGQTVTWNGTAMGLLIALNVSGNKESQIWGLTNPASGNNTLAISWTGGQKVFAAAISFTGVDGSSGNTSAFPHTASNLSVSTVSLTTAVGNMAVACEAAGGSQGTATGTLIYDDHVSGTNINAMANYDMPGASPLAIGNSGSNVLVVAADIAAAAGGGGGGGGFFSRYYYDMIGTR